MSGQNTYRGSFLARTLASNLRPFRATYSASLSMTGWMSGGGGMMAAACEETWASGFELFLEEIKQDERNVVFDFSSSKIQKVLYNITSYLVSGATAGAAEVVTWGGAVADGATAAASGGVGVGPTLGPAPVDVGGAMTPEGILL